MPDTVILAEVNVPYGTDLSGYAARNDSVLITIADARRNLLRFRGPEEAVNWLTEALGAFGSVEEDEPLAQQDPPAPDSGLTQTLNRINDRLDTLERVARSRGLL